MYTILALYSAQSAHVLSLLIKLGLSAACIQIYISRNPRAFCWYTHLLYSDRTVGSLGILTKGTITGITVATTAFSSPQLPLVDWPRV
jgi:hypothetical protein